MLFITLFFYLKFFLLYLVLMFLLHFILFFIVFYYYIINNVFWHTIRIYKNNTESKLSLETVAYNQGNTFVLVEFIVIQIQLKNKSEAVLFYFSKNIEIKKHLNSNLLWVLLSQCAAIIIEQVFWGLKYYLQEINLPIHKKLSCIHFLRNEALIF